MQENAEEKEKEFEVPEEFKKELSDIMNDSPTLKKIGEKTYRVYNLRLYSLNRILRIGFDLCKGNTEDITDDKKMIFALCSDMDKGAEIIAICLCNHLFSPDNVNKDDIDSVYTYNDNLIRYMKAKVINSTIEPNQWSAMILGAILSIDLGNLFTTLVLVKQFLVSLTKTREKAEEQLQSWQEAKSVM